MCPPHEKQFAIALTQRRPLPTHCGRALSELLRRTGAPGPIEVAAACKPFQPDDLDTKDPDELGVNYFAHTPKPDVLVLVDDDSE